MRKGTHVKSIGLVCMFLLLATVSLSGACAENMALPNVSSRLLSAVAAIQSRKDVGRKTPEWGQALGGVRVDETGRLEVMIQTTETSTRVLKELEVHGMSIEIYDAAQNLVQAWLPTDRIKEVAALPFVKFLDLPNYGVTNRPQE